METSQTDPLLLEKAARIRLLAIDVDGVLTDGRIYYDGSGNELKAFHTRDGYGLSALRRHGLLLAFITGRSSAMVERRASELGIHHVFQGRDDKQRALSELLEATDVPKEAVCYAGDDWLDLPVLGRVGLAVTVADADEEVRRRVHWVTSRNGGCGAVREICDLILRAQGHAGRMLGELTAS